MQIKMDWGFTSHRRLWLTIAIIISAILVPIIFLSRGGGGTGTDTHTAAVARSPKSLYTWALAEIKFNTGLSLNRENQNWNHPPNNDELSSYIDDFEESNNGLKGYILDGSAEENAIAVAENPIASYRMIRRIAHLLPANLIKQNTYFPIDYWLTRGDVNDSIDGILRIHNVYDIDIKMFVDGVIAGVSTGANLHGVHCYEIGVHAQSHNFHTLGIEWLELALSKADVDRTVEKGLIETALAVAIDNHDSSFDSRWKYDPYFFTRKLSETTEITENNTSEIRETQRKYLVKEFKGRKEEEFNTINFWTLCSDGSYKSAEETSKLFCWYENQVHPYWLIGPLKMELLTTNPDVYQVYDVIREKKIAKLKEVAMDNLIMSPVVDVKNPGKTVVSQVRTSVSTHKDVFRFPELASIPITIQQITGINVVKPTSSETLQIASYAFGGHYEVHLDAFDHQGHYNAAKGNRIATFMFYLSDVELGGSTAFLQGGVAVTPVKGSAVFWHNLYTDGVRDESTHHGACPIVLGTKWDTLQMRPNYAQDGSVIIQKTIANKWIHYGDQLLIRKCATTQKERYQVAVNGVTRPKPISRDENSLSN